MLTPDQTTAQTMYDLYFEAEKAILKGQSYTIKDRTLTRANLLHVQNERRKWAQILNSYLNGGSMRVRRTVPRDL